VKNLENFDPHGWGPLTGPRGRPAIPNSGVQQREREVCAQSGHVVKSSAPLPRISQCSTHAKPIPGCRAPSQRPGLQAWRPSPTPPHRPHHPHNNHHHHQVHATPVVIEANTEAAAHLIHEFEFEFEFTFPVVGANRKTHRVGTTNHLRQYVDHWLASKRRLFE